MANLPWPVIDIAIKGLEFGVVLTFLVGPVFFAILQASIEGGFWSGVLVAIGVSICDIAYVVVCYFGLYSFLADPHATVFMGYAGGFILIGFGGYHVLVKSKSSGMESPGPYTERNSIRLVVKGFLINVMSPMVPLFWIGSFSIATVEYGYTSAPEFALFFACVLATVLTTDIAKAYLSGKLRELITRRSLMIMNLLMGIVLIGFGGRLIYLAVSGS